tara:strand:- start:220 stop:504 length:285 start_codon:yes stop_codon:yes gene_type:complete
MRRQEKEEPYTPSNLHSMTLQNPAVIFSSSQVIRPSTIVCLSLFPFIFALYRSLSYFLTTSSFGDIDTFMFILLEDIKKALGDKSAIFTDETRL